MIKKTNCIFKQTDQPNQIDLFGSIDFFKNSKNQTKSNQQIFHWFEHFLD